jgi:hypothetical protein
MRKTLVFSLLFVAMVLMASGRPGSITDKKTRAVPHCRASSLKLRARR